jgi:hypothetical protein
MSNIMLYFYRMMVRDSPASPSNDKDDLWRGMFCYTTHMVVFLDGVPPLRKDMLAGTMPGAARSTAAKKVDEWAKRTTKIRDDIRHLQQHLPGLTAEEMNGLLTVVDDMETDLETSIPFNWTLAVTLNLVLVSSLSYTS